MAIQTEVSLHSSLMTKSILCLVIALSPMTASAEFFKQEDLHVAIGAKLSNQFQKRGQITYGGYQAEPIFAVDLFNPNLQWIGSSLHYRYFFNPNLNVRAQLEINSTKDDPLYFTTEDEDERVRREKTNELSIHLEYQAEDHSYLRFQLAQDTKAHKGIYTEVFGHYPITSLPINKQTYQVGLFSSLGAATKEHNEYLYGPSANHFSINNLQTGFMLTLPSAIDMFFPVIKVGYFNILGDENREAEFVKEKDGWHVEALFALRVF